MEHDTPLMISAGRGDNASWLPSLALEHHRRPAEDGQTRRYGCAMGQAFAGLRFLLTEKITRAVASPLAPWLETTVYTEESEQKNHFALLWKTRSESSSFFVTCAFFRSGGEPFKELSLIHI